MRGRKRKGEERRGVEMRGERKKEKMEGEEGRERREWRGGGSGVLVSLPATGGVGDMRPGGGGGGEPTRFGGTERLTEWKYWSESVF